MHSYLVYLTLNIIFSVLVNRGVVSLTLDVNPTLFVVHYNFIKGFWVYNVTISCHLPCDFASEFHSSMTVVHQNSLTREGRVFVNG